jgi:RimJ/RimL family protein N-acetyltransferase
MSEIVFREAEVHDSLFVLGLRNANEVRKFAVNSDEITVSDHLSWFEKRISNQTNGPFWIVEYSDLKIGYIRFDASQESDWEVSIAISERYRGKGFGKQILKIGIGKFQEIKPNALVIARIHQENFASIATFVALGFTQIDCDKAFNTFQLQ